MNRCSCCWAQYDATRTTWSDCCPRCEPDDHAPEVGLCPFWTDTRNEDSWTLTGVR